MRIESLPLAEVEDSYYNPREVLRPGDPDYEQIKASIEKYGIVEPLVYNERTGRLVGGHQRKRVLQELGYVEAPFSIVDLSDEEEKALNIALNRGGRWDLDGLSSLLDEIRNGDLLPVTGYTSEQVDELLRDVSARQDIDFLDDLTSPGISPDTATETAARERGARRDYFQLSYSVSFEQRDIILEAIRIKKEALGCSTVEALVAVCQDVIDAAE